jgi:hypothetical protein
MLATFCNIPTYCTPELLTIGLMADTITKMSKKTSKRKLKKKKKANHGKRPNS